MVHTMETLDSPKLPQNKFSGTPGCEGWLRNKKMCKIYVGFMEIHPFGAEPCLIEGCQPHICVQPSFDVKVPLAHKELLFEVPSLRVMCSIP